MNPASGRNPADGSGKHPCPLPAWSHWRCSRNRWRIGCGPAQSSPKGTSPLFCKYPHWRSLSLATGVFPPRSAAPFPRHSVRCIRFAGNVQGGWHCSQVQGLHLQASGHPWRCMPGVFPWGFLHGRRCSLGRSPHRLRGCGCHRRICCGSLFCR